MVQFIKLTLLKAPADRLDVKSGVNSSKSVMNSSQVVQGCFLDQAGLFDTNLFNVSPDEAKEINPCKRLLLLATYEALESAGYTAHSGNSQRVGTFIGQATDESDYLRDAVGASGLNDYFMWDGPSYTIDTTSSSTTAPMEMAYHALRRGECDIAVVGGSNLLSERAYNSNEDGHFRSEGVGVVILKRLPDALKGNDRIRGVITAVASRHTGHPRSNPHTNVLTQQRLLKDVLRRARLDPEDLDYVEVAGADDEQNLDQVESIVNLQSITPEGSEPRRIGSVKQNVGNVGAVSPDAILYRLYQGSADFWHETGHWHSFCAQICPHA